MSASERDVALFGKRDLRERRQSQRPEENATGDQLTHCLPHQPQAVPRREGVVAHLGLPLVVQGEPRLEGDVEVAKPVLVVTLREVLAGMGAAAFGPE